MPAPVVARDALHGAAMALVAGAEPRASPLVDATLRVRLLEGFRSSEAAWRRAAAVVARGRGPPSARRHTLSPDVDLSLALLVQRKGVQREPNTCAFLQMLQMDHQAQAVRSSVECLRRRGGGSARFALRELLSRKTRLGD